MFLGFFRLDRLLIAPTESSAAGDISTFTTDCTDPTPTGFSPETLSVSLAPTAPAAAAFPCTSTTSISITTPINLDSNPTAGTLDCSTASGRVLIPFDSPKMKIGGIQCQSYTKSELTVAGDATDDPDIDLRLAAPGGSYASGTQVDHDTTTRKLFGSPSGVLSTSEIVDGSDQDGSLNGDAVFGGSGTALSNGGFRWWVNIDWTNHDVTSADSEALTFTFNPEI
jgi:hypothetical protein